MYDQKRASGTGKRSSGRVSQARTTGAGGAGYVRLEQLTKLRESEMMRLHGMGPKALEQLRRALAAQGLAFADSTAEEGTAG